MVYMSPFDFCGFGFKASGTKNRQLSQNQLEEKTITNPRLTSNVITSNYLNINSSGKYDFTVYNSTGQLLKKGKIYNGTNKINLSYTSCGIYIIQYFDGQKKWAEKFVIK
jgi:hypothetical protein